MDHSNVGKFVAIVRNLIRGEHYYISLLLVKFTRDISVLLFFITIIRIINDPNHDDNGIFTSLSRSLSRPIYITIVEICCLFHLDHVYSEQ